MVGETQQKPFAQSTEELLGMFRQRKLESKKKYVDTKKMLDELERELAAYQAEEAAWDAAIFELENLGVQHTSRRKRKVRKEEEKEEEDEEEDEDEN